MNDYEYQYTHNGIQYNLPNLYDPVLTLHTGQGHHSSSTGRGSMSLITHIVGRFILGQAQRVDQGSVNLKLFQVTRLGMLILQKCAEHANGHQVKMMRNPKIVHYS